MHLFERQVPDNSPVPHSRTILLRVASQLTHVIQFNAVDVCRSKSVIDLLGDAGRRGAALDIVAVATRQLMIGRTRRHLPRVTVETIMGASVSGGVPLSDPSSPATSTTDTFIAAFCWQPLLGGVMIGAEAGRMSSRVGASSAAKYGGFSPFTYKV
jgi:hypothetical protein